MSRLKWGYNPGLPEGADTAWGARAIAKQTYMDLLPDRQDSFGPDKDKLVSLLNGGLLKKAQARYRELVNDSKIRADKHNEVILVDEGGVRVIGSTNASFGYFYVVAFMTGGQ